MLVGTKVDLREGGGEKGVVVGKEMGEKMKKEIAAERYVECSAYSGEGVKRVFDEVVRVGRREEGKKKGGKKMGKEGRGCVVL